MAGRAILSGVQVRLARTAGRATAGDQGTYWSDDRDKALDFSLTPTQLIPGTEKPWRILRGGSIAITPCVCGQLRPILGLINTVIKP